MYSEYFSSLPHQCPIKPGKYSKQNSSITMAGYIGFQDNPFMKDFNFPNGLYKFEFLAFTKDDPKFLSFMFLMEVNKRLGETVF
jgi:hypothetical protein